MEVTTSDFLPRVGSWIMLSPTLTGLLGVKTVRTWDASAIIKGHELMGLSSQWGTAHPCLGTVSLPEPRRPETPDLLEK